VVLLLLLSSSLLGATAEDELKAAHGVVERAVDTGNINLLESVIHPQALGFFRVSQIPVLLTRTYTVRDAVPSVLEDLSNYSNIPYENKFRVVGNTGIVCTTNFQQPRKKSVRGPKKMYTRTTAVYTKTASGWKLLSWHTSDIPLAK
jgi:hypothetical protein